MRRRMGQSGRGPDTEQALRRIATAGVEIGTVIDVGVLTGTPKLRDELPAAHHILIEPSPSHKDAIERNYANVSHQLVQVAASDVDADAFLVDVAIDGSQKVTHSTVVKTREQAEATNNKIAVHDMKLRRLDTIMKDIHAEGEILLKIDVDGHEMSVLQGAPDTLRKSAFVSIEAPCDHYLERANFLAACGFKLFDIVDLCYYRDLLWQVDLIFVRDDLSSRFPDLRVGLNDKETVFDGRAYREFKADSRRNSTASRLWKKVLGR